MEKIKLPKYDKYAITFDFSKNCYSIVDVNEGTKIAEAPPLGENGNFYWITIDWKNYLTLIEKLIELNRKYVDEIIYLNTIIDYGV